MVPLLVLNLNYFKYLGRIISECSKDGNLKET